MAQTLAAPSHTAAGPSPITERSDEQALAAITVDLHALAAQLATRRKPLPRTARTAIAGQHREQHEQHRIPGAFPSPGRALAYTGDDDDDQDRGRARLRAKYAELNRMRRAMLDGATTRLAAGTWADCTASGSAAGSLQRRGDEAGEAGPGHPGRLGHGGDGDTLVVDGASQEAAVVEGEVMRSAASAVERKTDALRALSRRVPKAEQVAPGVQMRGGWFTEPVGLAVPRRTGVVDLKMAEEPQSRSNGTVEQEDGLESGDDRPEHGSAGWPMLVIVGGVGWGGLAVCMATLLFISVVLH